jgi:hypothetical protein
LERIAFTLLSNIKTPPSCYNFLMHTQNTPEA